MIIMGLILAAWIYGFILEQLEKKHMERFKEFLILNGDRILNGESCEFEGKMYSLTTEIVRYQWCISVLVLTMTRGTSFRRRDDKIMLIETTLITLFGGWWGIPWGPVRSIQCFIENGKALTQTMTLATLLSPLHYDSE